MSSARRNVSVCIFRMRFGAVFEAGVIALLSYPSLFNILLHCLVSDDVFSA